jgi:hypothetical protein
VTWRSNAVAGGFVAQAVNNAAAQQSRKKCLVVLTIERRRTIHRYCSNWPCTLFSPCFASFSRGDSEALRTLSRKPF